MSSTRFPRRLVLSLVMALGFASLTTGLAQNAPVATAAPVSDTATAAATAAVTFADEFNGPAGSGVDGSKWLTETGDNVSNHERQYYTAGTDNAALDGQG
ncbi:1,3-beta-glucanase, partial [Streptomyces sp. NPDC006516]